MQLLKWCFFFVFLFIFLFACSSIVNAGQWKLTVRIDGNIYWAIHCVGGLGKLVVGGKCASSGPQNRFYIWKLIVGCCRRLYFLRLPFCWQSWGCDNCRAGCNVVSEYAALLQVLQLSLDFSLVNCPLQRGRGGGGTLNACCTAAVLPETSDPSFPGMWAQVTLKSPPHRL